MRKSFVQSIPVTEISKDSADPFASFFYDLWKETNGQMPDENSPIVEHLKKLVILNTSHSLEDSPNILYVGSESLFASLMPHAADVRNAQPRLEINLEYRVLVTESYRQASAGSARYDIIGSNYMLPTGPTWLSMERILLPFTADTGLRWIFCYSLLREAQKLKHLPNQLNLNANWPLLLSPDQLLKAPAST